MITRCEKCKRPISATNIDDMHMIEEKTAYEYSSITKEMFECYSGGKENLARIISSSLITNIFNFFDLENVELEGDIDFKMSITIRTAKE